MSRGMVSAAAAAMGAIAVTGCAALGGGDTRAPGRGPDVSPLPGPAEEAPRIGALDRAGLDEAPCGMFLWTLSRDPELVFYAAEDGAARMVIEGAETELTRTRMAGASFFGQRAEQEFRATTPAGETLTAKIAFEPGPRFSGGGYVQSGLIRLAAENGWERVTPVVGVAGCRE